MGSFSYDLSGPGDVQDDPGARMCTQVVGTLVDPDTGKRVQFTDGCEKADLMERGFVPPSEVGGGGGPALNPGLPPRRPGGYSRGGSPRTGGLPVPVPDPDPDDRREDPAIDDPIYGPQPTPGPGFPAGPGGQACTQVVGFLVNPETGERQMYRDGCAKESMLEQGFVPPSEYDGAPAGNPPAESPPAESPPQESPGDTEGKGEAIMAGATNMLAFGGIAAGVLYSIYTQNS